MYKKTFPGIYDEGGRGKRNLTVNNILVRNMKMIDNHSKFPGGS